MKPAKRMTSRALLPALFTALACTVLITASWASDRNETTVVGRRATCGQYGRPDCEPVGGATTKNPGTGPVGAAGGGAGGVTATQSEKDRQRKNCAQLSDRVKAAKADVTMFQSAIDKLQARIQAISSSRVMEATDDLKPLNRRDRATSPADDANNRIADLRYQMVHEVQDLADRKSLLAKLKQTQKSAGCSQ